MGSCTKKGGNVVKCRGKTQKTVMSQKKIHAPGMWPPDALQSESKTELFALINKTESGAVITFSKIHNRAVLHADAGPENKTWMLFSSHLQQINAELRSFSKKPCKVNMFIVRCRQDLSMNICFHFQTSRTDHSDY